MFDMWLANQKMKYKSEIVYYTHVCTILSYYILVIYILILPYGMGWYGIICVSKRQRNCVLCCSESGLYDH